MHGWRTFADDDKISVWMLGFGFGCAKFQNFIVFVWSQYDGANIDKRTIGYGWCQNHEAKLKIVGGYLSGSNKQDLDPTIHYITSVIVP